MEKAIDYIRLMRPLNCLMMGFAVLVGAALASPPDLATRLQNLGYGFITGFTLTAASMAINDYYDKEIDAVNAPNRPIPRGSIMPDEAIAFAFILTATGFAASYLTNLFSFAIAIVAWAVFVVYTTVGKRTGLPGNFLVSTCVMVPFIYGSAVTVNSLESNVLFFAVMAFFSNTGREITKGIMDVEGDELQNVRTLAVRYGEKNAATAAAAFYLLAVMLSPTPWLLNLVSFWFIPLVAVTDFGLLASSFLLRKDYSKDNARKIKNIVLLWFVFGLLAFVAGTFR